MALETARRARAAGDARPVFVVPLVWALIFKRRATAGLERESSHLERALRLASAGSIEQRFARLQRGVLRQRHERFGESAPTDAELASGTQFFAAQAQLRDRLLERLETRHGAGGDTEFRRRLHALRRSIRERADATVDQRREDLAMLREIDRLSAFTAERYGAATLTQEQIAESLKRLRVWLLTRTARDRFHAVVPVACAPRIAHLRVPEPLAIEPHDLIADPEVTTTRLVSELRTRMQSALDALHRELEPRVAAHRRPNPFAMPRGRTA
ncbi:MAG: hypothetical protein HOP12_13360 [Candidatus Eisenbacteria bacterium]|uniref:Uncharacterized protein n=1 Tax=Eiseniibacteriota bacterium TaxID=2212470 RepID=A0A849SUT3_UNCEI|nr:hypothetical protein [Candidatus Eisenbacteria bacterium]